MVPLIVLEGEAWRFLQDFRRNGSFRKDIHFLLTSLSFSKSRAISRFAGTTIRGCGFAERIATGTARAKMMDFNRVFMGGGGQFHKINKVGIKGIAPSIEVSFPNQTAAFDSSNTRRVLRNEETRFKRKRHEMANWRIG